MKFSIRRKSFLNAAWRGVQIILVIGVSTAMFHCISVRAQLSTATMFGNVTDPLGAAIPNATATMVQTDTNFTRMATTMSDGSYRQEFLPVGPYKVAVTAPGFKRLERTGIVFAVMQNAEATFSLEIGTTGETVNVTADIPLINLGNATLGRTVDNVEIDNLPLVGRNAYPTLCSRSCCSSPRFPSAGRRHGSSSLDQQVSIA